MPELEESCENLPRERQRTDVWK